MPCAYKNGMCLQKMACAYKKRVYLNFYTSARWSAYGGRSMYLCIVLPHTTRIPEGITQGNKLGGGPKYSYLEILALSLL